MALLGVFLKREFLVTLTDPSAVSFELKTGILEGNLPVLYRKLGFSWLVVCRQVTSIPFYAQMLTVDC